MKTKFRIQMPELRYLNLQGRKAPSSLIFGQKPKFFQIAGAGMRALSLVILLATGLAVTNAQVPDRSQPPKLGPPPSLKLKSIQHLKLSNGLPVLLYEKHEVPLVQIDLVVKTGAIQDTTEKSGL